MNTSDLLDNILSMIRSVMHDRDKLEKLHQYILNEIWQEQEEDEIKIPEKYKPLVKEIAGWLEAGLLCYINLKTLEVVTIPSEYSEDMFNEDEESEDAEFADDIYHGDMKRIKREWTETIAIEPPDSHTSFKFMEQFVHTVSDRRLAEALGNALRKSRPFRNFNHIIHNSKERESWFDFKRKCYENYAAEELIRQLPDPGINPQLTIVR